MALLRKREVPVPVPEEGPINIATRMTKDIVYGPQREPWKPSTTVQDIQKILTSKNLNLKTRQRPETRIASRTTSRTTTEPLQVGDCVPYFEGRCTLQRFVHKTNRWRVKLDDGSVEHLTETQIRFLQDCDDTPKPKLKKMSRKKLKKMMKKYSKTAEEHLNNTCYVLIVKKILEILKDDEDFDFKTLYDVARSQGIDGLFDDLDEMDINVMDQVLNVYDLQLKYFCPDQTDVPELKQELLDMYEKPFYLAVLWYRNHYMVLGKWDHNFYLYDPLHEFPIHCYYRDVIEFIEDEQVEFFWVQELDYMYNMSWYLPTQETIKGGAHRKRLPASDSDDSSSAEPEEKPKRRRSKRLKERLKREKRAKERQKREKRAKVSESTKPKRKRTNMRGWTEEEKDAHRRMMQKKRNDRKNQKKNKGGRGVPLQKFSNFFSL